MTKDKLQNDARRPRIGIGVYVLTVCEPDKCERWDWFKITELPSPMQFDTKHIREYLM